MRKILVILLFSFYFCLGMKTSKNSNRKLLKTKRCKYTFVVKEMVDGGHCPNQVQEFPQADKRMESSTLAADSKNPYSIIKSTTNQILSGSTFTQLEKRLKAVESMLEDQTLENTNLNQTISKQEFKLQQCDKMMNDYHKNITNMFRLMNHLQRSINGQKQGYRELEKKVSGIVLDVVEVNNVLEKKVTAFDNTVSMKRKNIQVETISKVLNCGQTNPETTFKGRGLIPIKFQSSAEFLSWYNIIYQKTTVASFLTKKWKPFYLSFFLIFHKYSVSWGNFTSSMLAQSCDYTGITNFWDLQAPANIWRFDKIHNLVLWPYLYAICIMQLNHMSAKVCFSHCLHYFFYLEWKMCGQKFSRTIIHISYNLNLEIFSCFYFDS